MGNNNITNLKDPSGPKGVTLKRLLFKKKMQKFAVDYKLEKLSEMGSENKDAIKAVQDKLKEIRMAFQVNSLRNELETMSV